MYGVEHMHLLSIESKRFMIEDLTGNIKRVVDGIAKEIGSRVSATEGESCGKIAETEARQVLIDWFLGEFLPK